MDSMSITYLFPLMFAALWTGISVLVSRIGGWHVLALRYRTSQPFTGQRFWMKSAGMRWGASYRSCVNLAATQEGMFLSVFPMFRIGHSPLFIPWSEISWAAQESWFMKAVRFEFQGAPGVPLLLSRSLAREVLANGPLRFEPPRSVSPSD